MGTHMEGVCLANWSAKNDQSGRAESIRNPSCYNQSWKNSEKLKKNRGKCEFNVKNRKIVQKSVLLKNP